MTWYEFFRPVAKGISVVVRPKIEGRENIPRQGPFFLIANHQSVLDPILIQANCPRIVHSFTKSTQFSSGAVARWLLPRINAIPTRRYRVDPQVVRTALRLLEEGEAVCIYPEGERSWDGLLQPLRRGTVRLILKGRRGGGSLRRVGVVPSLAPVEPPPTTQPDPPPLRNADQLRTPRHPRASGKPSWTTPWSA